MHDLLQWRDCSFIFLAHLQAKSRKDHTNTAGRNNSTHLMILARPAHGAQQGQQYNDDEISQVAEYWVKVVRISPSTTMSCSAASQLPLVTPPSVKPREATLHSCCEKPTLPPHHPNPLARCRFPAYLTLRAAATLLNPLPPHTHQQHQLQSKPSVLHVRPIITAVFLINDIEEHLFLALPLNSWGIRIRQRVCWFHPGGLWHSLIDGANQGPENTRFSSLWGNQFD